MCRYIHAGGYNRRPHRKRMWKAFLDFFSLFSDSLCGFSQRIETGDTLAARWWLVVIKRFYETRSICCYKWKKTPAERWAPPKEGSAEHEKKRLKRHTNPISPNNPAAGGRYSRADCWLIVKKVKGKEKNEEKKKGGLATTTARLQPH